MSDARWAGQRRWQGGWYGWYSLQRQAAVGSRRLSQPASRSHVPAPNPPQTPTLVRLQREVGHGARPRRRLALPIQQRHDSHVAALAAQQDVGRVGRTSTRLGPSTQQRHAADGVALEPGGGQQAAGGGRKQLDVAVLRVIVKGPKAGVVGAALGAGGMVQGAGTATTDTRISKQRAPGALGRRAGAGHCCRQPCGTRTCGLRHSANRLKQACTLTAPA